MRCRPMIGLLNNRNLQATRLPDRSPEAQWPLGRQVAILLVVAIGVASILSGELVRHFEKRYLEEALSLQTKRLLASLSASLLEPIMSSDRPILKTIVEETVKTDESVVLFEIQNARGASLRWTARVSNCPQPTLNNIDDGENPQAPTTILRGLRNVNRR